MTTQSAPQTSSLHILPWICAAGMVAIWAVPLGTAWNLSPDLGHSWVVPVLMGYLWWDRWDERPVVTARGKLNSRWWILAAVLILIQLPLRLQAEVYPLTPWVLSGYIAWLTLSLLIAAWLVAGTQGIRWFVPPLILIVSMLPVPTFLELSFIRPTRSYMASLVAEIMNLIGQPALASGTSVRMANAWIGIEEACGGIRSLQACVMIGLFFGEWFRFNFSRRLFLLGTGIAAAVFGNFARVLFLSIKASAGTEALQRFHDPAGWIAMIISLTLTGWAAFHWNHYSLPSQSPRARNASPIASPAWYWIVLLTCGFVLNEAGTYLWFTYGTIKSAEVPQWTIKVPFENKTYRAQPLDETARALLKPQSYISGQWMLRSDVWVNAYYVEWKKGQAARSIPFEHNPAVCMPLAGCELVETYGDLKVVWQGGEIPFFYYKFHRVGEDLLVAFTIWDPLRGAPLEGTKRYSKRLEGARRLWRDIREARKDQPAQLLAVIIPMQNNGAEQMETLLGSLIRVSR